MKATSKIICGLVLLVGFLVNTCIGQKSLAYKDSFPDKLYSAENIRKLLDALAQTDPTPFDKMAKEKFSSIGYWSFQNPLGPPLPGDPLKLDLWSLGDGIYVLDDRKISYDAVVAGQEKDLEMGQSFLFRGSNSLLYSTNDLWLEIRNVDLTNQLASLLLHNTDQDKYYQLLSKTNLAQSGDWDLGEIKNGDYGTNDTLFSPVNITDNPMMLFRAQQADWPIFIEAGTDAIEPNGSFSGQIGKFNIYGSSVSGSTNNLNVYYRITGTASNGVDYVSLSGMATITNNIGKVEIDVQPLADNLMEGVESVILTIIPTNTYLIYPYAGYSSATINLFNSSTTLRIDAVSDAVEPDGPPRVPAQLGVFQVLRSDFTGILTNLSVKYLISGTASNGVDYTYLTGTLTFLPGDYFTNIYVVPAKDNFPEGVETVTLSIYPTNTYQVDSDHTNATVFVYDSSTTIAITAPQNAVEPSLNTNQFPGQVGYFTISRSDDRNIYTNLSVSYLISGIASNGVDYAALSGVVTLAPDALITNIYVQPFSDLLFTEGNETVILTLINNSTNGYFINSNAAVATVTIADTGAKFESVTNLGSPIGMDYYPPSNSLIVSYNYNSQGIPFNFARIYTNVVLSNSIAVATNLMVTNWSRVSVLADEIKLATVKNTVNGFTNGEVYFGNGYGIGWLSADGTRSNLNWCTLTNSTVTNAQAIRGSLYVDQTGVFSNQLIVVASDSGPSNLRKGVWRVNAQGQPTLLTNLATLHLEGVITLPNDTNKWGPWAGKIITGDENFDPAPIFSINTNGAVEAFDTTLIIPGGIKSEDFDIIPTNQDLYISDPSGTIKKLSRNYFTNNIGDLLIASEAQRKFFVVRWSQAITNFTAFSFNYTGTSLEHVTFAPINLPAK